MNQSSQKILGISAFYHDSAAALIVNGEIIAAAQEERFIRKKNTVEFPTNAIKYCLEEGGLSIDELDAVVYYEKPFLKFERLLQTYYSFAPKGITSFLKAIPVWLGEKLFLKKRIHDELKEIEDYDKKRINLLFSSHHLSHAASSFFSSSYSKAAILTIDGVGEWSTVTIGLGNGNKIIQLKEMVFPHSVGLLYSSFTYFLGFKVNSGEYKLMGLAPYGNEKSVQTQNFIEIIKSKLVDIKSDGSIWLDQSYFDYAHGLRMVDDKKWLDLFGISRRLPDDTISQSHCNLAYAIQNVTEEIVVKLAIEAKKITGAEYLCMAGGVALNCVANGKLLALNLFKEIFVQPASGDAGGALGAALAVHYLFYKNARKLDSHILKGCYLGPGFSEKEILLMGKRMKAVYKKIDDSEILVNKVAALIADNNVIGWFQGRMEFGPRALGNRSILANPSNAGMQNKLNLKIKYREGFRPFAPSVLVEDAPTLFKINQPSPYMLFTASIQESIRKELPNNYEDLEFTEKLKVTKSSLPAITHLDYSARVQTVGIETNPLFYKLLKAYKKNTGVGVLINTSFNVRGEPIVCTPQDAYDCFMNTDMDYLIIENFLFSKIEQRYYKYDEKARVNYKND